MQESPPMKIEERAHQQVEHLSESWRRKPKWYREIVFVGVLYAAYSFVRNLSGSNPSEARAHQHALDVVQAERWLHIFNEKQIQDFFLGIPGTIRALNVWYGTAHFVVTIGILLWLFFKRPERYHKWRNVIIGTTLFALAGYYMYPLAPPRLLPASFGFEDTLRTIGGLWDFNNKNVEDVSNQYAAMPSLHVGWALWCAMAMTPTIRHRVLQIPMAIYPAITITAIVATANHYWMDVFGGAFVFALGYMVAETLERRRFRKLLSEGKMTEEDLVTLRSM